MNPESPSYPKPAIPTGPVPSFRSFGFGLPKIPSITELKYVINLTSGRSAIGLALQSMNIKPGDEVLVPAFHCISMIEPIIWLGGVPVFYRIENDTSITPENIKQKLSNKTRAIIAVHFFGFPQNIPPIREFCNENNIQLIEDCAHSYFGGTKEKPVGRLADYTIGSSLKFFPIYDGGCLCSNRHQLSSITINNGSMFFELKSFFNILENANNYGRLWIFSPFTTIISTVTKRLKLVHNYFINMNSPGDESYMNNTISSAADGGFHFDPSWVNIKMSRSSQLIISLTNIKKLQDKRREYYQIWETSISNIPGIRPLHKSLPETCVPHVFPALIDDPERLFPILKRIGVPVIRFGEFLWGGVDASVCPVSTEYSQRIFQFPCHQELTKKDIDWAILGLIKALTNLSSNNEPINE